MDVLEVITNIAKSKGFSVEAKDNRVEIGVGEENVPIKLVAILKDQELELKIAVGDLEDYIEDLKDSGEDYKNTIMEHLDDLKNIARYIISEITSRGIKVVDRIRESELDIIDALEESEE